MTTVALGFIRDKISLICIKLISFDFLHLDNIHFENFFVSKLLNMGIK